MKSFKRFVSEVAQPKPAEEKKFKDQHDIEVIDYGVSEPHQHTGEIAKPKAMRPADQEGDANYDKAYTESADLDESCDKKMKKEELVGGQKKLDHNKNGKLDAHDFKLLRAKKKNEEADLEEKMGEYGNWSVKAAGKQKTFRARHAGEALRKATKSGHFGNTALDANKHVTKEEVEVTETTNSATKKPVNITGPDGKTRTVMKTTRANQTDDKGQDKIKTNESVEMLDETFKQGIIKLKDGSQTILKKEDANALNTMFKGLSSSAKKKMTEDAMKSKKSFEEILGFARAV